jgi:hypothetical protein
MPIFISNTWLISDKKKVHNSTTAAVSQHTIQIRQAQFMKQILRTCTHRKQLLIIPISPTPNIAIFIKAVINRPQPVAAAPPKHDGTGRTKKEPLPQRSTDTRNLPKTHRVEEERHPPPVMHRIAGSYALQIGTT